MGKRSNKPQENGAKVGKKSSKSPKIGAETNPGGRTRVKAGTSKAAAADRRALFIEAYVTNGGNATQAAISAGYSKDTARQQSTRLLTHVAIRKEVEARRALTLRAAEAITGVTMERTLRELGRLVYADPRKLVNADGSLKQVHELDDDTAACIASLEIDEIMSGGNAIGVTKKLKVWDKNSAIEKAMKHLGLYKADNEQQPAPTSVRIEVVGVRAGG